MSTQTVEQITRLAPFMEDYTRKLLESAYKQTGSPVGIPAQQVAGLTPEQQQAGALITGGLGSYMPYVQQGVGLAQQGAQMLQDPTAYQQYMSPYTTDVIDQVGQDIARQTGIQQNVLGGRAVGAGAFGGSRQGIAQGEIGRAGLEQFADTAARLRESGFQQAQNLVGQRAAGLGQFGAQMGQFGGQLASLGQQDISNLLGIGSLYQGQNQAVLDAARNTAMQQAYEPYQRLGFFSDILRGVPTTQSTIGTTTTPQQSPLSQIGGIAATGLGLAGQLGFQPFKPGG